MNTSYVRFTKEMKGSYTLLVPNMLPYHFKLLMQVLKNDGYSVDLLTTQGPQIAQTGLKYVHNDTCYPAILVIGQFIDAIQSGKYDPHKVALMYFQTGGGCRASNYVSLLRKALEKAGYPYVPVIALSLSGIEHHPGLKLTVPLLHRAVYCFFYGDLLLTLVNQCKPYELQRGSAEALAGRFTRQLAESMEKDGVSFKKTKAKCAEMIRAFAALPMDRSRDTVQVGVVGEIYVKYSPLGNNNLEQFLVDNGAEVTFPGLMGFILYCVYNMSMDYRLYRRGRVMHCFADFAYRFITTKQEVINDLIRKEGTFRPSESFDRTIELIQSYMGQGCNMGEGWLLPAEMLELADSGVKNIVCTQPFGCLPNHICGKGMMKPIKDRNPDVNIVAVDYDASASRVNQENRIKLMLANARSAKRAAAVSEEGRGA